MSSWWCRLAMGVATSVGCIGIGVAAVAAVAATTAADEQITAAAASDPIVVALPAPAPIAASDPVVVELPVAAPVVPTTEAPAPAPEPAPAPVAKDRVLAAAPAPAPAPEPTPASEPAPDPATPQQRGAQALERLDYPWERLGYSVAFEGPNPGLLGKADCNTNEIFIYVRPEQTIEQLAFVTAFELGHAIDCGFMTDQTRSEWAAIRGFAPGWTWFPDCVCAEDDFGSGDISMVFATWLVPEGGYRWRSNLAPQPTAEQLQRLLPYLRR